ncbi:hypothetical protein BLA29_013540 [Euroglyphus maynei]|uniref:Uncharacterized protein n=1 Tax=Euroglyphus maynei TaxID=6958 RepID=A0A1Y3BAC1_EURMA|nr:hypothetical protein BLA29_013540 [Euroglyphus maynei]
MENFEHLSLMKNLKKYLIQDIFVGYKNPHNKSSSLYKSYLAIVIICLSCYYNALFGDFVFDDISAIRENLDIRTQTPIINIFQNDFWGIPMYMVSVCCVIQINSIPKFM